MSDPELINLIVKNPITNEAISVKTSIDLNQYNTLYNYKHCIAAMNNTLKLSDFEKKIVSNPNFHHCEQNLLRGLHHLGIKLTEDEIYSMQQDMLELIVSEHKDERVKNKQMIIFYFLGSRQLLVNTLIPVYNEFIKNFRLYSFVESIKQFMEIYESNQKIIDLFDNIPSPKLFPTAFDSERYSLMAHIKSSFYEHKYLMSYFLSKIMVTLNISKVDSSLVFLFQKHNITRNLKNLLLRDKPTFDIENNIKYIFKILRSKFFEHNDFLKLEIRTNMLEKFLGFPFENQEIKIKDIYKILSNAEKFYISVFIKGNQTETIQEIKTNGLDDFTKNFMVMSLKLTYNDVNYIMNYLINNNLINNSYFGTSSLTFFNKGFKELLTPYNYQFPQGFVIPNIDYVRRLKYIDYLVKSGIKSSISLFSNVSKLSYIENMEIIFNQIRILFYTGTNFDYYHSEDIKYAFGPLIYHNKLLLVNDKLFEYYVNPNILNVPIIKNIYTHIAKICLFLSKYQHLNTIIRLSIIQQLIKVGTSTDFNQIISRILEREFFEAENEDENIYKQGKGVHDENRDELTTNCINVLLNSYNLSDEEVEKYFNLFWVYGMKLESKQKQSLLRVLGLDENQKPAKRSVHDFGGLLTSDIIVEGNIIKAKRFIAYFWAFSETFIDETCHKDKECIEREKDNIKYGVMKGLIDSLQDDRTQIQINNGLENSHVVCNPGKIQRLVTSTLQGRLKDKNGKYVYVDKILEQKDQEEVIEEVIEGEDQEKAVDVDFIKDYSKIKDHLKDFIKQEILIEGLTLERFFIDLFIYVQSLESQNIHLSIPNVIYYLSMMGETMDGLCIDPNISIISAFEDEFLIEDFKEKFLREDQIKFDFHNPQVVEAKNMRNEIRIMGLNDDKKFIKKIPANLKLLEATGPNLYSSLQKNQPSIKINEEKILSPHSNLFDITGSNLYSSLQKNQPSIKINEEKILSPPSNLFDITGSNFYSIPKKDQSSIKISEEKIFKVNPPIHKLIKLEGSNTIDTSSSDQDSSYYEINRENGNITLTTGGQWRSDSVVNVTNHNLIETLKIFGSEPNKKNIIEKFTSKGITIEYLESFDPNQQAKMPILIDPNVTKQLRWTPYYNNHYGRGGD